MDFISYSLHFEGNIYHELCYCPQLDQEKWLDDMKCSAKISQINEDLKQFPKIDFEKIHGKIIQKYGNNHALCHYSIVDNQVRSSDKQ